MYFRDFCIFINLDSSMEENNKLKPSDIQDKKQNNDTKRGTIKKKASNVFQKKFMLEINFPKTNEKNGKHINENIFERKPKITHFVDCKNKKQSFKRLKIESSFHHQKKEKKINQLPYLKKNFTSKVNKLIKSISTQISDEMLNEMSLFDRIKSDYQFWEQIYLDTNHAPNETLKTKLLSSIDTLKKSKCFKFLKKLILAQKKEKVKKNDQETLPTIEESKLMKNKIRFLRFYEKLKFWNKNFIYFLSNLNNIHEKIRSALCHLLFENKFYEDFLQNLEKMRENRLLGFIQSVSSQIIFELRKNRVFAFQLEKKNNGPFCGTFSSDSEINEELNEESFQEKIKSSESKINSEPFLSMIDHLHKSSEFETQVKSDPIYELFEKGEIPLHYIKHWFFLKSKTQFFKNEIISALDHINLEVKRNMNPRDKYFKCAIDQKEKNSLYVQNREIPFLVVESCDKNKKDLKRIKS